ncbi:MAG: SEC-C domain-containing protein [Candidatus Omnitrophica bacterium]|nr:SEC-C domain-containing protein [Candidatus Omnitrophota bacterium]
MDIRWRKEKAEIKIIPKVRHNEPCPCGNGKKYKKCYGG